MLFKQFSNKRLTILYTGIYIASSILFLSSKSINGIELGNIHHSSSIKRSSTIENEQYTLTDILKEDEYNDNIIDTTYSNENNIIQNNNHNVKKLRSLHTAHNRKLGSNNGKGKKSKTTKLEETYFESSLSMSSKDSKGKGKDGKGGKKEKDKDNNDNNDESNIGTNSEKNSTPTYKPTIISNSIIDLSSNNPSPLFTIYDEMMSMKPTTINETTLDEEEEKNEPTIEINKPTVSTPISSSPSKAPPTDDENSIQQSSKPTNIVTSEVTEQQTSLPTTTNINNLDDNNNNNNNNTTTTTDKNCIENEMALLEAIINISNDNITTTKLLLCPGEIIITDEIDISKKSFTLECSSISSSSSSNNTTTEEQESSSCILSGNKITRLFRGGPSFAGFINIQFIKGYSQAGSIFYIIDGQVVLTNCTLSNSTSTDGGVIYVDSNGVLLLDNVLIYQNLADTGGAITSNSGTIRMSDTKFYSNFATVDGGALHLTNSDVVIDSSIFAGNTGSSGGAIAINEGVNLSILGTTVFFNNAAGSNGSDLYVTSGSGTSTTVTCTSSRGITFCNGVDNTSIFEGTPDSTNCDSNGIDGVDKDICVSLNID